MGLTSALSVGRTALAAYQAALQVVGNNIANSATPGYSRLSPRLTAVPGPATRAGQLGSGVQLSSVRRNVSETLEARLRTATSDKESAATEQTAMDRTESIFNPLSDANLGSLLSEFFDAVSSLQNNPENIATRGIVITAAETMAGRIRTIHNDLIGQRNDLNDEIAEATQKADQILEQIAYLNTQITTAEAGMGGTAGSLRDQRDQLLSELSNYFGIAVRQQPSGAVNVYVGNEAVVQFGQSFGLKAETEIGADGIARTVVKIELSDSPVTATGGLVEGLVNSRDVHLAEQLSRLDTFAGAIIREVNNVHASGKGLQGFSSLRSLTSVLDADAVLSTADNGIAFLPRTGSFFIDVRDNSSGTVVRTQIHIDLDGVGAGGDSTLNTVAADITANVAGVTATVSLDKRLQLTADSGVSFTFADDTSGFLAAMGLNAFFAGTDSSDIEVNSMISANPALVAAARSSFTGDGSNATAMVGLKDQAVAGLGNSSLNEYYTAAMGDLAVRLAGARSTYEAGTIIFDSLTAQRESLSGVNMDEEAISLVSYQRAYEGAARFINVVNEMMQTLLSLVR